MEGLTRTVMLISKQAMLLIFRTFKNWQRNLDLFQGCSIFIKTPYSIICPFKYNISQSQSKNEKQEPTKEDGFRILSLKKL